MQSSQSSQPESNSMQQGTTYLSDISNMTVDEIIMRYQHNAELLYNALLAKADEDKRRAAAEWHQAEQSRAHSMYIDYEINLTSDYISGNNSICSSNTNPLNMDLEDNSDLHISPFIPDSLQLLNDNPLGFNQPLGLFSSDFYMNNQQEQNAGPAILSSPTSMFASPSQTDGMNPIPFDTSSSNEMEDTFPLIIPPPFSSQQSSSRQPAPSSSTSSTSSARSTKKSISKPSGNTAIIKLKSGRSVVHRTQSYECVMNLREYNTKIMDELSKKNDQTNTRRGRSLSSSEPLDHNKVMEALRAKLKKSSLHHHRKTHSSPETRSSSSPPPPPPPPNVHPTTGVLLLDLKSRKRKPLVTKSNASGCRSNSIS